MSEKRQLRQQVKQLKQTISSEQRVALSQNICSAIEKLPGFETVSRILLYHALPDEVDTGLMLSRWSKKKQLYLPIVNGDNLIVSPYDPRFLKQGAFGIWEPGDTRETDPGSIDWIIVPGVAFDKKLNRLGRQTARPDLRHKNWNLLWTATVRRNTGRAPRHKNGLYNYRKQYHS